MDIYISFGCLAASQTLTPPPWADLPNVDIVAKWVHTLVPMQRIRCQKSGKTGEQWVQVV